jgi:hypothetical protein
MPRKIKLSPIRIRIYQYIVAFKSEHDGNSPSIRQIGDQVGISWTSVVRYHLATMERLGMIKLGGNGVSRMIVVIGGTWAPPANIDPAWTVTQ